MDIIKAARKYKFGSQRKSADNDYFSDRLSHRFTTKILLVFIAISTVKRFYLQPISCWVSADLNRYSQYMHKYCWLKGTYYVDQHYEHHALSITKRNESVLKYYQWIYIFLVFQTFLFYLPRLIWSFITQHLLNYDLFNIIDAAQKYDTYKNDKRRLLKFLSASLTRNFANCLPIKKFQLASKVEKKINKMGQFLKENNQAVIKKIFLQNCVLTISYIFTKFLYLALAIFQLLLMNAFLSNISHSFYGYEVINNIMDGKSDLANSSDSKIFPR